MAEEQIVVRDGDKLVTDATIILSEDGKVLSYNDQEYIKACGEFVAHYSSGEDTYCVTSVDHKGDHIDRNGRKKPRWMDNELRR